jgi:uncharacterized protein (DUF983 family)
MSKLPSPFVSGLKCRCPHCGEGALFSGFLTVRPSCQSCGTSFDFADAGDGPAVFIMLIVGFIVVAGALWMEFTFDPPYWLHALVWIPVTAILCLSVLRPMKATMIALQYVNGAREGRVNMDGEQ